MQKLFNFMAVASFTAVAAQVIAVSYLINNQDKYLNQVRQLIVEEVTELIPDMLDSAMPSGLGDSNPLDELNVNPNF